ncbi:GspE/PulE family protein [Haliovirga abyssi]|uniref:Type II secretion system protein GspE n=1 Tax=Haliovirga abyssi TaxID=2996794 RepID=A0AAU9DBN3_9FUSO|nr:GspE/PulE family protein [Haliovirga abyssi]BDU50871.1 type II secretion system protein GspE [Haliovirga abyssi]
MFEENLVENFDLKNQEVEEEAYKIFEENFIHEKKVFPYKITKREIFVAMLDVTDAQTKMKIKLKVKRRVVPVKMTEDDFYLLTNKYFGVGSGMLYQTTENVQLGREEFNLEDKEESAEIIKFVNRVILDAYKRGSTDIHMEPLKNDIILRYRIDGVLHNIQMPAAIKNVFAAVVSRIKIMADLDIAEKRLPQDGRIKIKVGEKEQDLRVSILPTINGEGIVIRILANQKSEMTLEKLGMETEILNKFRELIHKPNGIVLVTGPTGSGKTTTLFSAIKEINDYSKKIITIEDPVEYQLDGVSQIQVKPDIGLTFAQGLRAILRQDPDIILVGEIRDKETAEIAIRASLTGHLVFATLHTNDSVSAVTRLIDMGIEPYLITSSLIGVLAQRLVRVICPYCKTEKILDNGEVTYFGKGCDFCFETGYKGRTSIHELFLIDNYSKKDILNEKSNFEIKNNLKAKGWKDLKDDGMLKIEKGITTYEEILRVAW